MAIAGSSIAAGIAGCSADESASADSGPESTASGSDSTAEPESSAIGSIETGRNDIVVTLTGNVETDRFRLISPDGTERSEAWTDAGVETVELEYFEDDEDGAYTAGEHTLVAVRDDATVQERAVDLRPALDLTGFDIGYDGSVAASVENSGSGSAWLRDGQMYKDQPSETSYSFRADEAGQDVIPPGETRDFRFDVGALDYNTRERTYDEYCTGEGDFAHEVDVSVEEQALGTLTATGISLSLTGERETLGLDGDTYTCAVTEAEGTPIPLGSSQ